MSLAKTAKLTWTYARAARRLGSDDNPDVARMNLRSIAKSSQNPHLRKIARDAAHDPYGLTHYQFRPAKVISIG